MKSPNFITVATLPVVSSSAAYTAPSDPKTPEHANVKQSGSIANEEGPGCRCKEVGGTWGRKALARDPHASSLAQGRA